jgi:hypothetical protein
MFGECDRLGDDLGFIDDHWVKVTGGHGLAEVTDEAYLAIPLRNVDSDLGVLHGWCFYPERLPGISVTPTRRRSAACPGTCMCQPGTWDSGRALSVIHQSLGSPKPAERSTPCRPHRLSAGLPPSSAAGTKIGSPYVGPCACPRLPLQGWINSGSSPHLPYPRSGRPQAVGR